MPLYDEIKTEVEAIIAEYKKRVATGSLDLRDILAFLPPFIGSVVRLVDSVEGLGADKKAAVLIAFDKFVAEIVTPIDLPGPDRIIDPIVERLLHGGAEWLVEGIYQLLKQAKVIEWRSDRVMQYRG